MIFLLKPLMILKISLYMVLPLTFLGCDPPVENTQVLRSQVQTWEIQQAQRDALAELEPNQIQSGEVAYFVETQEVVTTEGPLINLVSEWTTEVTNTKAEGGFLFLTTIKTMVDHNETEKPIFKFEDEFAFEAITQETHKAVEQNPLSLKLMEKDEATQKSLGSRILKVTYHDLQIKKSFEPPPVAVTKSKDCSRIENCEIEMTTIDYEVVFHFADSTIQKHQIQWKISPDVPFFATILSQCATTLVPLDNLRVLVKQCQKVRDFKFSDTTREEPASDNSMSEIN